MTESKAAFTFSDPGTWPLGGIWVVFFVFTLSVALFAQLWFLPTFIPASVTEHGILLGTDSVAYHELAAEISGNIDELGWSAWVFMPNGWAIAGFISAVYTITVAEPWVMTPLNAAAHATCGVALVWIVLCFTNCRRTAFLAALPYVLFPTASFWYSQLLKDGFFNMGLLVFLAGWIYLVRACVRDLDIRAHIFSIVCIALGFIILGTLRPYMLTVVNVATFVVLPIALCRVIYSYVNNTQTVRRVCLGTILLVTIVGVQLEYPTWISRVEIMSKEDISMTSREIIMQKPSDSYLWRKLQIIAGTRYRYLDVPEIAVSTLDAQVQFNTPLDMFTYIPRAMQIAFFAPFPNMWLGEGSTPATTIMRRVSMLEMLISYGLMFGIPISLWAWRRRVEIWMAVAFCSSIMLVYALATPNIGALYRFRYGYFMVFLSLGILGWRRLLRRNRDHTK